MNVPGLPFWSGAETGPGGVPCTEAYINVIAQFHCNGSGSGPGSDTSQYAQTPGFTGVSRVTTPTPPFGDRWCEFTGSGNREIGYQPGNEGLISTFDWTIEGIYNLDATQLGANRTLFRLCGTFGPAFVADTAVLHFDHSSYPDVLSFWIFNHSSSVALLVGTTDIAGVGNSYIAITRIGNTWRLFLNGVKEDEDTFSGSISGTLIRRRYMGGDGSISTTAMTGYLDEWRETLYLGRYSGDYDVQTAEFPDTSCAYTVLRWSARRRRPSWLLNVQHQIATFGTVDAGQIVCLAHKSAGKLYFEVAVSGTIDTSSSDTLAIGLYTSVEDGPNFQTQMGNSTLSYAYLRNGDKRNSSVAAAYGNSYGAGDIIGVAWDVTANKIFFALNNTWQNSGDPVAGTNPAYATTAGVQDPGMSAKSGAPVGTIAASSSTCAYAPPSGYTYWTAL